MAAAIDLRTQVSKDMGDFFSSTTTATGSTSTLVDDKLNNFDDGLFIVKFNTSILMTGGAQSGQERWIASKTGNTAVPKENWAGATGSGSTYEVHRLFSAEEKDDAVTEALEEIAGEILFEKDAFEVTSVANQQDYDITSASFHNDEPRQVHLVSSADTEDTVELYGWQTIVNTSGVKRLHFVRVIEGGRTLRLFGHKKTTLSDITVGSKKALVLSARAAMYLLDGALVSPLSLGQERQPFERMLARMAQRYAERKSKLEVGFGATNRTNVFQRQTLDISFRTP